MTIGDSPDSPAFIGGHFLCSTLTSTQSKDIDGQALAEML
jgi:hypothetical protein